MRIKTKLRIPESEILKVLEHLKIIMELKEDFI